MLVMQVLGACGGSGGDATLSCQLGAGKSCQASTSDASIIWNLDQVKPGEEYIVIARSQMKPEGTKIIRHDFSFQTSTPSAPVAREEAENIRRILGAQRGLPSVSQNDTGVPIQTPRSSASLPNQNITGDSVEFFIPNPSDYVSQLDGKVIPYYVQSPDTRPMSGRTKNLEEYAVVPNLFRMLVDPAYLSSSSTTSGFRIYADKLKDCLTQVMPRTMDWIGHPEDVDGVPEINMSISDFTGAQADRTLGLFSSRDRFRREGSRALLDSNFSESIYLAPSMDASRSCSTSAHELQHMVSFDRKVLSRLSARDRDNIKKATDIPGEYLGLNEAYSHLVEELSMESQGVSEHIYNFWTSPSGSSFALESVFSDYKGNSRSRGLNLLLLYFAIKKAGGRLSPDDTVTKTLIANLINSQKIGFENIAEQLGIDESQFLEDFFRQLALSLFDAQAARDFIPALESGRNLENQAVSLGFQINERSSDISRIRYSPPFGHPYQFELLPLQNSSNMNLPAQGLVFMRYIVPDQLDEKAKVKFRAGGKAFSLFLVRIH